MALYSLAAIALIVAVGFAAAFRSVIRNSEQAMRTETANLESRFHTIDGVIAARTEDLATSISLEQLLSKDGSSSQEKTWSVQALLSDILNSETLSSVSLYTENGKMLTALADGTSNADVSQVPEDILQALRAAPESAVWVDDVGADGTFAETAAVYRSFRSAIEPHRTGIVRFELNLTDLSEHYATLVAGNIYEIYLYNEDGKIVLPRSIRGGVWQVTREGFDRLRSGAVEPLAAVTIPFRDEEYLVLSAPLPYGDYVAVACVSESSMLQNIRILQLIILAVGAACILSLLLLTSHMAGMLTAPIAELADRMRRVENGDLPVRSKNNSPDEIGDLARNFNRMLDDIQELIRKNEEAEKMRHRLELNSLQLQITPHFLYNSLDGISALIQLDDKENAFEMSQSLSRFYRSVLSQGRTIISLKEELALTENYLQVQCQRYRGRFDYHFKVDASVQDAAIVKLTLQPLVENAIYHGFRNVRRHGILEITGRADGDDVILRVRDNGKGMGDDEILSAKTDSAAGDVILHRRGYGMYNVDHRMKLYFGESYGLHITSQPGSWTCIEIRFPHRGTEEFLNDIDSNR